LKNTVNTNYPVANFSNAIIRLSTLNIHNFATKVFSNYKHTVLFKMP